MRLASNHQETVCQAGPGQVREWPGRADAFERPEDEGECDQGIRRRVAEPRNEVPSEHVGEGAKQRRLFVKSESSVKEECKCAGKGHLGDGNDDAGGAKGKGEIQPVRREQDSILGICEKRGAEERVWVP